ncbi:MAG: division/cell wall cluster transcriptional repressor MraZ [Gammaproteobacteria bacterium]|jgi:MraZ protein|nr:division/cell wall cluster transcriptional repressor MraZ [Gammaproteobacteria bacterium]
MFRGVSALNLDAKGRLQVPVKYRQTLQADADGCVVITANMGERCLWLYPLPIWEEIERTLVKLPSLDATAQKLKRILMGHATDVELDSAGRVLVSTPLREFAGIDKRVVLIGQGNKFEIWNEAHWNERREQWLSEDEAGGPLPVELESLAL